MRYNIKRLFREHEVHKAQFDKIKEQYLDAVQKGLDTQELSREMNQLRHAMSLCRQFIGQEVVNRWREGTNLNTELD